MQEVANPRKKASSLMRIGSANYTTIAKQRFLEASSSQSKIVLDLALVHCWHLIIAHPPAQDTKRDRDSERHGRRRYR